MHNIEVRPKWDKNIKRNVVIKSKGRLSILYILNKAVLGMSARDIYEKKIHFKSNTIFGN
jgi:hypothetical protein